MIQQNTIGQHTELQAIGGGKWLTLNRPTNFHEFFKSRILLPGEDISDYKEVTDAEKAAIEAADAAWVRPPQVIIDLWNDACIYPYTLNKPIVYGQYNEDSGFSEYCSLKDITYKEVITALKKHRYIFNSTILFPREISSARFILPIIGLLNNPQSISGLCKDMSKVKELVFYCNVNSRPFEANNASSAFYGCTNLETIHGGIEMDACTSSTSTTNMFYGCTKLKDVSLRLLKVNISFSSSPLISYKTLNYLITNAANTQSITVTVHANTFAKITGDETNDAYNDLTDEEKTQWTGLLELAAEKNIQFATA